MVDLWKAERMAEVLESQFMRDQAAMLRSLIAEIKSLRGVDGQSVSLDTLFPSFADDGITGRLTIGDGVFGLTVNSDPNIRLTIGDGVFGLTVAKDLSPLTVGDGVAPLTVDPEWVKEKLKELEDEAA